MHYLRITFLSCHNKETQLRAQKVGQEWTNVPKATVYLAVATRGPILLIFVQLARGDHSSAAGLGCTIFDVWCAFYCSQGYFTGLPANVPCGILPKSAHCSTLLIYWNSWLISQYGFCLGQQVQNLDLNASLCLLGYLVGRKLLVPLSSLFWWAFLLRWKENILSFE